jgi:hypothetical protein
VICDLPAKVVAAAMEHSALATARRSKYDQNSFSKNLIGKGILPKAIVFTLVNQAFIPNSLELIQPFFKACDRRPY